MTGVLRHDPGTTARRGGRASLILAAAALTAVLAPAVACARAAELPDFTSLVEHNRPAVVNISTTRKIAARDMGDEAFPDMPGNAPFNEFFKRFFRGMPGSAADHPVQSLGSGFIISSDGYILTNAHVVGNADHIVVTLLDHEEKQARLVGSDERSDVALLKIEGHDLPTVRFGNSDTLKVGEWVLAIGSPFGLDYSATAGIISAMGRNLPSDTYERFIQTDVALNPGNSGGPLFDMQGEVVGINSQIYSNTGGYMGLSFAIPINDARNVAEQLEKTGKVTRGWLGVVIQNVDQDLADSFGLDKPAGALVSDVVADGPAGKAGIAVGDVILEFNGQHVGDSNELPPLVAAADVGSTASVRIARNGKQRTVEVRIGELPPSANTTAAAEQTGGPLNMVLSDLDAGQRSKLGTGDRGVMVNSVGPGPAAEAGIRAGDVILAIKGRDVKSAAELGRILNDLPAGKPVAMLVLRDGTAIFVALKPPPKN